jgi:hypothetical protein
MGIIFYGGWTYITQDVANMPGGSVRIGRKNRRPLLDRMLRSSAHLPTIVPGVTHSNTIAQKIINGANGYNTCNCKKDTVPSGRQFFCSLNYKHQKPHGMAEMSHFPICRVASGVCSLRNHFFVQSRLEIWYRRTCCTTRPRCRRAGLPPEFN